MVIRGGERCTSLAVFWSVHHYFFSHVSTAGRFPPFFPFLFSLLQYASLVVYLMWAKYVTCSECTGVPAPAVLPQTCAKASAAEWDFLWAETSSPASHWLGSVFHHEIHCRLQNKCVCTAKQACQKSICNRHAVLLPSVDFTVSFVVTAVDRDAEIDMSAAMENGKIPSVCQSRTCKYFMVWSLQVSSSKPNKSFLTASSKPVLSLHSTSTSTGITACMFP